MGITLRYIVWAVLGYLIGSFPTGVVLTRNKYGLDVREMGSGNIGATNVTRVFGWYAGALVFLIDFLKGLFPLLFLRYWYPHDEWVLTIAGAALVIGHCFSAYLKFSGGKGVATSVGCLLAVAPWGALIGGLTYALLLLTVRISAVGSLGGLLAVWIYLAVVQPPQPVVVLVLAISSVVIIRHHTNIKRLISDLKSKRSPMKKAVVLLAFLSAQSFGAFSTSPQATWTAAKKSGKPVLISFYGIWCPPCNELEETVFETPNFYQKAKTFHLLKVDADAKSSWELKSKYKVGGYPTVVFTNSAGSEMYRVVGYRTPAEFLRIMDVVAGAKGKDLEKSCASEGAQDLWRCALVCTERGDKACAEAAYKKLETKVPPGSIRHEQARAYFVEHAETEDLKRVGYEKLLAEFPASPLAYLWALDYLKLFDGGTKPEPKKSLLEAVIASHAKIAADARAEEAGVTLTDMAQIRAILLDKLGKREEAKAAWKNASAMLEALAKELPKGSHARGFSFERISCLEEAGEADAALNLANEYRQKYPKEFTFHYSAASILERSKRYPEALPIAKQAYEYSYGDNKIRAGTLLVNLYATVPDKESATRIFESVTKEIQPDTKLEVRTHRYLKKLDEAYKRIGS